MDNDMKSSIFAEFDGLGAETPLPQINQHGFAFAAVDHGGGWDRQGVGRSEAGDFYVREHGEPQSSVRVG